MATAIVQDGSSFKSDLDQALMQVKSLGMSSAKGITIDQLRSEYPRLEDRFFGWKSEIEVLLSEPSAQSVDAARELGWKLSSLSSYFKRVADLAELRAHLGLPVLGSDWLPRTRIRMSSGTFGELTGLKSIPGFTQAQSAQAMLTDPDSMVRIEPVSQDAGSADSSVLLSLNERLVQGVVAQAGAYRPNRGELLKAVQFSALVSLYEEFSQLKAISDGSPASFPDFSLPFIDGSELRRKARQLDHAQKEQALREALVSTFQDPGSIVSDKLVAEAEKVWAAQPGGPPPVPVIVPYRPERAIVLRAIFEKSERDNFAMALKRTLQTIPVPLQDVDLRTQAAQAVVDSLAETVIEAKLQSIGDVLIGLVPDAARIGEIDRLISVAQAAFAHRIDKARIRSWLQDTQAGYWASHKKKLREELLRRLSTASSTALLSAGRDAREIRIEPSVLLRALRPGFESGAVSGTTLRRIERMLQGAGTSEKAYLVARLSHADLVKKLLSQIVPGNLAVDAKDGGVDFAAVQALMDQPVLRRARADDPGADEKDRDRQLQMQGITELLAIGRLVGWDRPELSQQVPSLADLKFPAALEAEYRKALLQATLANPLLTVKLSNGSGKMLYEELARLDLGDANAFKAATAMLEDAVRQELLEVGARVAQVAAAQKPEDLTLLIVKSSLIKEELKAGFPSLVPYQQAMLREYATAQTRRDLLTRFSAAYQEPMTLMLPFFVLDLATAFVRPTRPFVRAIHAVSESLGPYISTYFLTTLPLILAKFGQEGYAIHKAAEELRETEGFFHTGASETGIFSYFEVHEGREKYDAAVAALKEDVLWNAAFFLATPFRNAGRRAVMRLQDGFYERQFGALGLKAEEMTWKTARIEEAAQRKMASLLERSRTASGPELGALLAEMGEVRRARETLVQVAGKHQARRDAVLRDFAGTFELLGIAPENRGFNVERIQNALAAMRAKAEAGTVSAKRLLAAERQAAQLLKFIGTEWQFVEPGALSRFVYEVKTRRAKAKGDTAEADASGGPSRSRVRERLYEDLFDFWSTTRKGGAAGGGEALPDHYATLGVGPQASAGEIKAAYRAHRSNYLKLANLYHPDKEGGDRAKFEEATAAFEKIEKAYNVLKNDAERASYDLERMRSADEAA